MNFLKILAFAVVAVLAATSAFAYNVYSSCGYGGAPRIGAYTSVWTCNQGFYDYISPPIVLSRYGAQYHLSNLRTPVYAQYPVTYFPTSYHSYFGYPYGNTHAYSSLYGAGGFKYRAY